MITHCRTCREATIVAEKVGARCGFCDSILVTACIACGRPVYQKRRGRPSHRCDTCQTLRKQAPNDAA